MRSASAARASSMRSATSRPATPTTSRRCRARRSRTARERLEQSYDAEHGGFGGGPKFPHPTTLELLLAHWHAHRARRCGPASAHDGHAYARLHGATRPLRSPRRRLLPLQRRPVLVDPALREDALRQRPAARRLRRRVRRDGHAALRERRGRDGRLGHARHAGRARRLLLDARRRFRARGRQVLRLDARPSSTQCSTREESALAKRVFGLDAARQTSKASTGISTSPRRPRRPPRRSASIHPTQPRLLESARAQAARGPRAARLAGPRREAARLVERAHDRAAWRARRACSTAPELADSATRAVDFIRAELWQRRPPQSDVQGRPRALRRLSRRLRVPRARLDRAACSAVGATSDLDLRSRARRRAARALRGRRAAASSSRPTITSA